MCAASEHLFPEESATHNPPEIFHFPSNPLCPKHPSSCPLIPKSRSRGKFNLFLRLRAIPWMLWLSRASSRNVPASYCDRQSQGQLLGRGLQLICISLSFLFHFYLCPQFLVLFPLTQEVQTFQLSSSRPGFWCACLVFCFVFFGRAVIKPHCLVFRGPTSAARLPSDALHTSVPSCLLHNPGHAHAPSHFFFFFNLWICSSVLLNIVVIVPVWKLRLSALSHLCLKK